MPTFTDYLHDVSQFRKFQRELLVLATGAQKGMTNYPTRLK
jgi:hypothetical protein